MAKIDDMYGATDDCGLVTSAEARALGVSGAEVVQYEARGVYRVSVWPYRKQAPYAIPVRATGEGPTSTESPWWRRRPWDPPSPSTRRARRSGLATSRQRSLSPYRPSSAHGDRSSNRFHLSPNRASQHIGGSQLHVLQDTNRTQNRTPKEKGQRLKPLTCGFVVGWTGFEPATP